MKRPIGSAFRLAILDRTLCHAIFVVVLLIFGTVAATYAQSLPQNPPRVGLIIANFAYSNPKDRLSGPERDADVLEKALAKLGFVGLDGAAGPTVIENVNLEEMKANIEAFNKRMTEAGALATGFIYFAGHGASNARRTDNYLLPVNVQDVATADVEKSGWGVRDIVRQLNQIRVPKGQPHPKLILVIDACRTADEAAVSGKRGASGASTFIKPDTVQPENVLVALSTGVEQVASDSGLYSAALVKYLTMPGLEIADVFSRVQREMAVSTKNNQIPEYSSQINQIFCMAGCTVIASGPDPMTALRMAIDLRPTGDTGQIKAAEELTREHKSLAGLDLSGIYFAKAQLNEAQLQKSVLTLANLDNTSFEKSDLTGSTFAFASMKDVHAVQANTTETRFYFADASGADFAKLNGPRSNWHAALLRGASFRGANLQGASFMMSDLRDADFTDADLRGAFFNGALIAGAKFNQARVSNTDMSGTAGSASQFSQEQQAGLCGTAASGRDSFKNVLRTYDPAAPIGDRFHDIFEESSDVRSGLISLDPCAVHTAYAAGKSPVWSAGQSEEMIDEFVLDFPPKLLGAADREAIVLRRAHEAIVSVANEQKKGVFVSVLGKIRRETVEALRRNVSNAALLSTVVLDRDAVFLYRVRFHPETIDDTTWRQNARAWADRDGNGNRQFNPAGNQWAQFFPTGTRGVNLTEPEIELFKQWTHNRARQFPTRISFNFKSSWLQSQMSNMLDERYDPNHTPFETVYPLAAYAKEHPPYQVFEIKPKAQDYESSFQTADFDSVVHLRKPLVAYTLKLPRSMAATIRKEKPMPEAQLEIHDSTLLSLSGRTLNVLECDLADLHITLPDGVLIR